MARGPSDTVAGVTGGDWAAVEHRGNSLYMYVQHLVEQSNRRYLSWHMRCASLHWRPGNTGLHLWLNQGNPGGRGTCALPKRHRPGADSPDG